MKTTLLHKSVRHLLLPLFVAVCYLLAFSRPAKAETQAQEITKESCVILVNGSAVPASLTDNREDTYQWLDSPVITITSLRPIGGVYIKFDRTPPAWTMEDGETQKSCGKYGFLHE